MLPEREDKLVPKDILQMGNSDRKRLYIIQQAIEGRISQKKAAELIGLTDRQIRRMIKTGGERG